MRRSWVLVVLAAVALASCDFGKSPAAPTAIPVAGPPLVPPPLPTAVPGVLSIAMPIDGSDLAATAFGLTPFGYHGADHALDGHPGWDVEYRIGGVVRAAAAGTVESVFTDAGRFTVHLAHLVGTHHYRTVYTNLSDVSVAAEAAVTAGQRLGTAGTVSQMVGTTPITYAMTHFQLDDFEYYRETPNPNAVSPEPFLSSSGRTLFDGMWQTATFVHELVEPFATNRRDLAFPATRTWTRAGGNGPAGLRFSRRSAGAADYEYALLSESGTIVESGTVVLNVLTRPYPSIDLVAPTAARLGIYEIVSGEMRLSLANAGSARPTDLGLASLYRTPR